MHSLSQLISVAADVYKLQCTDAALYSLINNQTVQSWPLKILGSKRFEKEVFLVLWQNSPENYLYLYKEPLGLVSLLSNSDRKGMCTRIQHICDCTYALWTVFGDEYKTCKPDIYSRKDGYVAQCMVL